jgi:hypothetical protein
LKRVAPKCPSISEKILSSDSRDEDMSGVSGGIKKVINLFATGQAAKNFAETESQICHVVSGSDFIARKKHRRRFLSIPAKGRDERLETASVPRSGPTLPNPVAADSPTGGRWSSEESVEKVVARKKAGMSGDGTGRSKTRGAIWEEESRSSQANLPSYLQDLQYHARKKCKKKAFKVTAALYSSALCMSCSRRTRMQFTKNWARMDFQ